MHMNTIKHILFVVSFALLMFICFVPSKTLHNIFAPSEVYYYNAYSPGYDEYFIVKSDRPLTIDTITHFDDKATVTAEKTGYTCKILSIYLKK